MCMCRDFDRNLFHIALFTESDSPRLIVRWQIDHIRQYGSNNLAFKFQSGRSASHTAPPLTEVETVCSLTCSKSSTGVDWFIVDTDVGAAVRIHRAVDYWAKHIVDQIKNTRPGVRVRSLLTFNHSPQVLGGGPGPEYGFAPLTTDNMRECSVDWLNLDPISILLICLFHFFPTTCSELPPCRVLLYQTVPLALSPTQGPLTTPASLSTVPMLLSTSTPKSRPECTRPCLLQPAPGRRRAWRRRLPPEERGDLILGTVAECISLSDRIRTLPLRMR